MVYKNSFVVCVKVNGRILRDYNSIINLPFGSEYSILLKNLESRKAVVSVEIDGEDVLDGDRLIVDPNSKVELEGFKKRDKVTNKFKFIEKTEEIEEHRGNKAEDGLIRVEVQFEKKHEPINWSYTIKYDPYLYHPYKEYYWVGDNILRSSGGSYDCCSYTNQVITANCSTSNNEEGITVKGSDDVNQGFVVGYTRTLEDSTTVIVIKLKGSTNNKKVEKCISVKDKLQCPSCGRKYRSDMKYCPKDGTFLEA